VQGCGQTRQTGTDHYDVIAVARGHPTPTAEVFDTFDPLPVSFIVGDIRRLARRTGLPWPEVPRGSLRDGGGVDAVQRQGEAFVDELFDPLHGATDT
jgi:hypothetical protein